MPCDYAGFTQKNPVFHFVRVRLSLEMVRFLHYVYSGIRNGAVDLVQP